MYNDTKWLKIYTYSQAACTLYWSVIGGVQRYWDNRDGLILPIIHPSTQFVWFIMHSSWSFIVTPNLCGSSQLGTPPYPVTLIQSSSVSENCSVSLDPFGYYECSTIWIHCDCVNIDMYLHTMNEQGWRTAGRMRSREFGDALGGRDGASWELHFYVICITHWRCVWQHLIWERSIARQSIWRWYIWWESQKCAETEFIGELIIVGM